MYDLVATADARSKGYGEKLHTHVQEFAHGKGCEIVAPSCERERAGALRFYEERMGYERTGYSMREALHGGICDPGRNVLAVPGVIGSVQARTRHSVEAEYDPLAARLADGDPRAPRELVERHHADLYRYAFGMLSDTAAAEDAVQGAFERAFGALGKYPEERIRAMRLRPWLYRVTLNVVRNALRRGRRETPKDPAELSQAAGAGVQGRREEVMDVLSALGRLPERQRAAVTLRYLQDLPYREIRAVTGWPEGTARTLVRRGLKALRDLLEVRETEGGDRG